jgi:hypothetical protein
LRVPDKGSWLKRVSTVSKGRLHLHSSGVPSFPDDAIKGVGLVRAADIKTCPILAT